MGFLFVLIPVLAILWIVQIIGTYFQMSHYRKVLGGVTAEGDSGFVGVGNAKARFGKGVILILVSDAEGGEVQRALRMRGMSVFARFREAPDLVGMELESLRDEELEEPYEAATRLAARRAIEQIEKIQSEKAEQREEEVALG